MTHPICFRLSLLVSLAISAAASASDPTSPIATEDVVFAEVDGLVAIEAEHFYKQSLTDNRAWHLVSSDVAPDVKPDADPAHLAGASGGAYLEILPDTRATHGQKLIHGENFSPMPGKMTVAHYKVHINTPGRYYVWARVFSTGSEDNGVHVGLDGEWPESGQRWQTTKKKKWIWDCRQRTQKQHGGVPMQLYLDIEIPGEHEIMFSQREDGFEMDKFVLANDKKFRPEGIGPEVKIKSGNIPPAFKEVPEETTAVAAALVEPRQADGDGATEISGELKQWHKVTLTLDGPFAHELGNQPNPFTDYRFDVTFTHESGSPSYKVPGYFAADGNAAETSASSGTTWRAHLSPDKAGKWSYSVSFNKGKNVAVGDAAEGEAVAGCDGGSGTFDVTHTDKTGRDFRAKGRLTYVGKPYLQFAGSKEYFIKAGADAPENFLSYRDFDGEFKSDGHKDNLVKDWQPHVKDWRPGDPTWQDGKGKGIIGAVNYLAYKGVNAVSFLTLNIVGDDQNVFPYVSYDDHLHLDVSRLAQWEKVFAHAQQQGLFLHFKTQEAENQGLLDKGKVGLQRKLYYRELIARFAHHLALNWNMGEENGPWGAHEPRTPRQKTPERLAMADYFHQTDPYHHHIVIHNGLKFDDLLGPESMYTGASIQFPWQVVHSTTLEWLRKSADAGKPWAIANDEQNPADMGVPPDPGFEGHSGEGVRKDGVIYTLHDIRKGTLWGNLMAGGWGVEYYFGYKLPESDLNCQNYRSRDKTWDYCRVAIEFFANSDIPFWEMANANPLVGNLKNDNSRYCLANPGIAYLVYLPNGGSTDLDLRDADGSFTVKWFNPRTGGKLVDGSVMRVQGGGKESLGEPPSDPSEDWLVVVRR